MPYVEVKPRKCPECGERRTRWYRSPAGRESRREARRASGSEGRGIVTRAVDPVDYGSRAAGLEAGRKIVVDLGIVDPAFLLAAAREVEEGAAAPFQLGVADAYRQIAAELISCRCVVAAIGGYLSVNPTGCGVHGGISERPLPERLEWLARMYALAREEGGKK